MFVTNSRPFSQTPACGRCDAVRIEGLMREHGAEVTDYTGTRLLTMTEHDHDLGVAFVEPGVLAFGAPAAARRAIDTKAGAGADVTTNRELMKIIRDLDQGSAWAVGRLDAFGASGRIPKEVAGRLPRARRRRCSSALP